ncbi:MAG: DNA double-strand break repair nuclease NurA [Candidatus Anstonellaceae archaeon]
MEEEIEAIARQIQSISLERQQFAKLLRGENCCFEQMLEKQLYYRVEPAKAEGKVAAVDCGIVGQEFHGFDFLVSRTVGVVFEYQENKPKKHWYFPSASPTLKYDIRGGLENYELAWHKSLFRLKNEILCAAELISKHKPEYIFLDGSIAPLISDKPSEESQMLPLYKEVIELYKHLYESCLKSSCTLCGIIKDSRSKRFVEIVSKHPQIGEKLKNTADSNFLFFLLQQGERTCAFEYSSCKHHVLKDLGEWADKIISFYIKPVENDRPLRVEFLSNSRSFSEIASFVHTLSCLHKAYAYPAILIEADLRAALSYEEVERTYGLLFSKLKGIPELWKLRRNMRPFR